MALLITMALLIITFLCIAHTASSEDFRNVFVLVPEGDYDLGSSIPVSINVFVTGKSTDPDSLDVQVEQHDETNRTLNVTREGVGRYTCDFILQLSDIDSNGVVHLLAQAHFGDTTVGDWEYFYTVYYFAFKAEAVLTDPDDLFARPGQDIDFEMKVTFKGEPVDPDIGTLRAYLDEQADNGTDWYRPFYFSRQGMGLYNGTFHIPPGINESTTFYISADMNVTIDGRTWSRPNWGNPVLHVPVSFYRVWAHHENVTRESADLTLYFEDLEGDAVVDGAVHMIYSYGRDIQPYTKRIVVNSTTDADGLIHLHLTYEDIRDSRDWVEVYGHIDEAGLRQHFGGRVHIPEPPPTYSTDGLRIRWHIDEPLPVHEEVTFDLFVTMDGKPVSGFELFVFIVSEDGLLFNAAMVTDEAGIVSFNITTGNNDINMIYYYWWEGRYGPYYRKSNHWFRVDRPYDVNVFGWFDGETTISVEPFPPGGPVEVTFENPSTDGMAEAAAVLWGVGNASDYRDDDFYPPWLNWEPMYVTMFPFYPMGNTVVAKWDGEAYRATIILPPFLPPDVRIFVMGMIEFKDSPYRDIRGALLENVTATLPHARPKVNVWSPIEGEVYHGGLDVTGNASGVFLIREVQVVLEGGEWWRASWTDIWNISLGSDDLHTGTNTIHVRAFDGWIWSRSVSVTFTFDRSPLVWIDEPTDGSRHGGLLSVEGRASDDISLEGVEVRMDGGEWVVTDGTNPWTMMVDTRTLEYGHHSIEARAFDGFTHSTLVARSFFVDQPPVIVTYVPPYIEAFEDVLFTLYLEGEDEDVDALTWTDDSDLFDIDPHTGSISFVPTKDDVGTHKITVTVRDGSRGTDVLTFDLEVIEVNDPPVFLNKVPHQAGVYEDEVIYHFYPAADEEDDVLTWWSDSVRFPISPTNGSIRFDPIQEDVGEWWFNVTVADSQGLTAKVSFSVVVVNVNDAPVISSISPVNGSRFEQGRVVTFEVVVDDEDGDDLEISWTSDGVTLGTGPSVDYNRLKSGKHVVRVTVFDGEETVEEEITVSITRTDYTNHDTLFIILLLSVIVVVSVILAFIWVARSRSE
jgi:hypothetical protein